MKIALAQIETKQACFDENLSTISAYTKNAKIGNAELVVFPEMCISGFNYALNKKALNAGRNFTEDLCKIAKENSIYLAATVPALSSNSELPANRLIFINPKGELEFHYDKIHLFGLFNEDKYVADGKEILVKKTNLGDIGLAICYDLRFPEMFVQLALKGAQIVILPAAWPHPRMEHLKILCKARALENQNFLVCVNQAGSESFGTKINKYGGESCVISPMGITLASAKADEAELIFCDIDLEQIEEVRRRIPVFKDRKPLVYK